MDSIALVSDIVWIKRGVAKHVPEKVKLNPEELRELIQGNCYASLNLKCSIFKICQLTGPEIF